MENDSMKQGVVLWCGESGKVCGNTGERKLPSVF